MKELEEKPAAVIPVRFKMEPVKKVSEDPFEQAAYAYSLIESVVVVDIMPHDNAESRSLFLKEKAN